METMTFRDAMRDYATNVQMRPEWRALNRRIFKEYGIDMHTSATQLFQTLVLEMLGANTKDEAAAKYYAEAKRSHWLTMLRPVAVRLIEEIATEVEHRKPTGAGGKLAGAAHPN